MLISTPLIVGSAANAALLVHYTFDNNDAANSGTLADGTPVGGSSYVPSSAGALPVIIGGHGRDAADPAGMSFNGLIDDVRIYDEPLTAAEILAARNAVIPEPSSMGLLALTSLLFLRRRR